MGEHLMVFGSVEEAYKYQQAIEAKNYEVAEQILKDRNGRKAYEEGKKVQKTETWEEKEDQVMEDLLKLKGEHCKTFREYLVKTRDKVLIEDTKNLKWGRGTYNNPGLNRLGEMLMKLREELLTKDPGNDIEYSDTEGKSDDDEVSREKDRKRNDDYGGDDREYGAKSSRGRDDDREHRARSSRDRDDRRDFDHEQYDEQYDDGQKRL